MAISFNSDEINKALDDYTDNRSIKGSWKQSKYKLVLIKKDNLLSAVCQKVTGLARIKNFFFASFERKKIYKQLEECTDINNELLDAFKNNRKVSVIAYNNFNNKKASPDMLELSKANPMTETQKSALPNKSTTITWQVHQDPETQEFYYQSQDGRWKSSSIIEATTEDKLVNSGAWSVSEKKEAKWKIVLQITDQLIKDEKILKEEIDRF